MASCGANRRHLAKLTDFKKKKQLTQTEIPYRLNSTKTKEARKCFKIFITRRFFNKDGSPEFVRVYYDKRYTIDAYTAIFTKTANMLDGYNRVALCLNSLGDYYHDELPPRTYPGKPCAWDALPEGVQKSILSEYRAIHGIAG